MGKSWVQYIYLSMFSDPFTYILRHTTEKLACWCTAGLDISIFMLLPPFSQFPLHFAHVRPIALELGSIPGCFLRHKMSQRELLMGDMLSICGGPLNKLQRFISIFDRKCNTFVFLTALGEKRLKNSQKCVIFQNRKI